MAKSRPIDVNGNKCFKVLVLNKVDKLSKEAQHSLWHTMEVYSGACQIVLCCDSVLKVLEAVRSCCLNIHINSPSKEQIVEVLEYIAKKEGLQLPLGFTGHIAQQSKRDLRREIICFEPCKVQIGTSIGFFYVLDHHGKNKGRHISLILWWTFLLGCWGKELRQI